MPTPDALMQSHGRLVAGLRKWLAQPGPDARHAGRSVAQIDTHISTLLLVGDEVYKLRKPVQMGFADFSTATRRRTDCEEELRLNRRTAPQLYRDVLPIIGTLDAPRIPGAVGAAAANREDAGTVVLDWVLRMRRFDDAALLDRMAAVSVDEPDTADPAPAPELATATATATAAASIHSRPRALTPAHIDALAATVAAFHAALPSSPPAFGQPQTVLRWARDNISRLQAAALPAPAAAHLTALAAWTEAQAARHAALLQRRHDDGHVRECHGDLHLGNLVLLQGRPVPFDCIEFNADLRHIDVLNDIAFTFMDLHAHRLPRLAWRLVNQYLQATGDYAGAVLLPFYAVYRALVRAMVAALRDSQMRAAQVPAEALRYIALAVQLAGLAGADHPGRPQRPALLVVMVGLSGSGKSTAALALAQTLGAWRIRSDVERKRLVCAAAPTTEAGVAPGAAGGNLAGWPRAGEGVAADALYSPQATGRTYARLHDLAQVLLAAGQRVVVDAACLQRSEREGLCGVAQALAAAAPSGRAGIVRVAIVHCQAPVAVLRQRIVQRAAAGLDPSDANLAVLEQQLGWFEPPAADEPVWVLDTDAPLALMLGRCQALAERLDARAAALPAAQASSCAVFSTGAPQ